MGHDQRGSGAEFDGKVAVRDGVQRVVADILETERGGDVLTIDRESGAGQGGGAQRQAVDAFSAILHALGIAPEHFHVRHHVVSEGDRLRHLQVGEARHDGLGMLIGQVQQGQAQGAQEQGNVVDGAAYVQADVGGNLVVA